tara:strand:- start:241 stop:699 length:459 start_codon:yes stop_codon:yes gene_type:complete
VYNISKIFVSLFGIGFIPYGSGTIASFITIFGYYFLFNFLSFFSLIIIFLLILFLSFIMINCYDSMNDSSEIVIDEFLGVTFIMIFFKYFSFQNNILMFSISLITFRFFDIVKIFPSNYIDKNMKNTTGIILDDLFAAIYSIIILLIINDLL